MALDIYDRLDASQSVRDLFAFAIDNRQLRENPVRIDEEFFFPEAYGWEDEPISIDALDRIEFVVPLRGYSAFLPYNEVNIGRPTTVAKLERLMPKLPPALLRKQAGLIMEVFRRNPTCYDGQPFFDSVHPHPGDKGTYDNTLPLGFADPANPTITEAKALIHAIRARFVDNLTIQAEVIDAAEIADSLTLIVHNSTHWTTFERVRAMARIDNKENELAGSFSLKVDKKPAAGQENRLEAVLTESGGIKPAFFVIDKDPMLEAEESNRVPQGYVAIVFKQIVGVKPAYPASALQAS